MVLSSSMMLEWLGHQHENQTLVDDGLKLKNVIGNIVKEGASLTRDIGGNADTAIAAKAILDRLT